MDLRGETPEHPLPALIWRPMAPADLDGVAGIALIGFPDHFEGRDCFENRLILWPQGCFVLADETDRPLGYLIAYPWRADEAPALNTLIAAIPDDAAVMYLHDLCLHPDARGQGATAAIVERLADQARAQGSPALALVAVNDATGFWARYGFSVRESEVMTAKLAGYGSDARYMIRPL
ncbi:GNAT family N-acetyltransferase [Brevundimonas sp.]|uniref:GNAT family N-acetyltransferase n=1 Tax=Brevundimonas sp. TaxID=1871086 RepID=UPI0025B8EF74|nr:GNAT family N-acetyltransferase [Brevundimonas sp.]